MKTITSLSPAEQSAQLTTFVDFFVKEFMSEIWFLEESARGNIPGREEASIGTLFNVACGLASLVPVPGSVIALVASQKLIVASMKLASGIADAVRESEWGSQVLAVAEVVKSTWDGYGEQTDDITLAQGEGAESAGLEEGSAVDTESLSVLARWLGHQLAQRYEQALTERLSTEPEAAIMGLARTGARRSLAFLTDNGGMTGSPQERTERLLAGVVQGKPMSWYERPLKWFAKGERLAGRDDLAKEKFTAERLYVNGVWTSLSEAGYVCHTHSRTEWFNAKTCGGQPKYGYVSGHIEEPELKPHEGEVPGFAEWLTRRVYQSVTREMIEYYLASEEVGVAREAHITATKTLSAFLAENFEEFPKHGQAGFRGDLSGLDLSSGNFSGSDLSGSQISGDLSYSRFDGALLYATNWHEVTSASGSQVNFARAQLGFSEMAGANFQGDVDVTQADLTCVNLTGASFGAVQQVGTKWYKAILIGVEYEGIAKAQREQLATVTAEQTVQFERFKALNDKVTALEAQVKPLLESLAAKQPAGAGAGAGGEIPVAQRQALLQQQALEELLAAQEKRIQFEAYCEEKLAQLTETTETHTDQIATLESNLKRVQAASAEGQAALQSQIDQLSERVDQVEARVDGLARRSSVIKLKVDDLSTKLSQMHMLLEEQRGLTISKDLSLADREAILEKSAIGKVLDVYCSNLSQRQKDLHYYVRPDVIERIPDRKTPGEYMLAVEEGKYEDTTTPLLDEVDAYLKSDDSVILLLGEPGAGKSLFAWYGSQSRLQHYQMVLQDREPTETPWLPIVIELKNYRLSELTGLLPQYLKKVCHLSTDEIDAIQNDQKPAHKLIVVLDGFDELKQDAGYDKNLLVDLFQACGAQDWYAGQVKLVVTCRVRELPDAYTERQYFGRGVKQDYRRRILLPFSQDKISDYLDERTKVGASKGLELLSAKEYLQALKASDSVKEMVRNPFVLRLFVEALPGLVKAGVNLNQIKRYDIYNGFVKQWFEREVNRLDVAHRKALGVDTEGVRNIAASFERYAGILAIEMYRQDTLVVSYDEAKQDDPAFEVWSKVDEVVADTDIDEEGIKAKLAQRYQKLKASEKRKLQIKEKIKTEADYVAKYLDLELDNSVDQVTAQLEAFKMTSPLRQTGDQYSFIHKSFYEYFMASWILASAGSDRPIEERVRSVLALFAPPEGHEARRLYQEPEAIQFVYEYWSKAEIAEKDRLRQTWFTVIEATKGHPEHGVAGSNAGTLLNWVNVNFLGKDWRGAHIPGVDLRGALLENVDLRGADLSGAWLGKLQASNVDMSGANLTDVELGGLLPVGLEDQGADISCHPSKPIVAVCYGTEIRQYNYVDKRWVGAPMVGHTRAVLRISYSPDGKWIVSGGDKTIRQWDAETGEQRESIIKAKATVYGVCYSPDGKWLAAAAGRPRQWDAESGDEREIEMLGLERPISISYSPDGKWLAAGSNRGVIMQWDTVNGEQRCPPLDGSTNLVNSLSYSPDGKWLLASSGSERQWHAETGVPRGAPLVSSSGSQYACYSPDGKWLVSANSDGTIQQWDAESGEHRGAPLNAHNAAVHCVRYTPDGRWFISAGSDKTLRQWDAAHEEISLAPAEYHRGSICSLSFSPNGMYLASGPGKPDYRIRQWEVASGQAKTDSFWHRKPIYALAYSPDGEYLVSGGMFPVSEVEIGKRFQDKDSAIPQQVVVQTGEVRNFEMNNLLYRYRFGDIMCVCYSEDCKQVTVVSSKSVLKLDASNWEIIKEYPHTSLLSPPATMSADRMWLSSAEGPEIMQWSLADLFSHYTDSVTSVCYSPDGMWLASSSDKTIRQCEAANGKTRTMSLVGHTAVVTDICYSPDGKWIASGSDDCTIRQWDAASGEERSVLINGHHCPVTCVTYCLEGKLLASGYQDGAIRLWFAETGELQGETLVGHPKKVTSLSYSSDGIWLASSSEDKTVCQWSVISGELRCEPFCAKDEIRSVNYSPDGKWLVSSTLNQWEAATGEESRALLERDEDFPLGTINEVIYSPDGKVLIHRDDSGIIGNWDARDGGEEDFVCLRVYEKISSICYSPDGKWLAIGGSDTVIRKGEAAVCQISTTSFMPQEFRHQPPSKVKASARKGLEIPSNLRSRDILHYFKRCAPDHSIPPEKMLPGREDSGHTKTVHTLAYSVDGEWLASGGEDNTICQWQTSSREQRGVPLVGHTGTVFSVNYSPDGRWLLSGSADKSIIEWHAASGEIRGKPLLGHTDAVTAVRYSPDGTYIASGGSNGVIRLWRMTPELHGSVAARRRGDGDEEWQLFWASSSRIATLSAAGLRLCGAYGLQSHQLELLRHHGYEGGVNPATGLIEDEHPTLGDSTPADRDRGVFHVDTTTAPPAVVEERSDAPMSVPQVGLLPEEAKAEAAAAVEDGEPGVDQFGATGGAAASATPEVVAEPTAAPLSADPEDAAPQVTDAVAAARLGSELLLSLARILKRAKIFSPSHKLRDKLVPIYQDPANANNTYVPEDRLRSAELALTEKQICKFARVNLNAARESSNASQVRDAVDLFEVVVGKEQATVHEKVARVVGAKKQAKYYECLMFGRTRLAELSADGEGGAGASIAAPPAGK